MCVCDGATTSYYLGMIINLNIALSLNGLRLSLFRNFELPTKVSTGIADVDADADAMTRPGGLC